MSLIAFVSRGQSAYDRHSTNGCDRMGTMTNRILVFVVRFSKGDTVVSKKPVSVWILFALGRSNSFKKRRVTHEDNFASHHFRKIRYWWSKQADFVCFQHETLMDLDKSFRPQPLAERVEGVVSRDVLAADTYGFAIDSDFGKLLTEFSIGWYTFFDF